MSCSGAKEIIRSLTHSLSQSVSQRVVASDAFAPLRHASKDEADKDFSSMFVFPPRRSFAFRTGYRSGISPARL